MAKTPHFHAEGTGSIPGQGTRIPHASWLGKNNFFNATLSFLFFYCGNMHKRIL